MVKYNKQQIALSQYMAAINMSDWEWAKRIEIDFPQAKEKYEKLMGVSTP